MDKLPGRVIKLIPSNSKSSSDLFQDMAMHTIGVCTYNTTVACKDWIPIYGTAILIKIDGTRVCVILISTETPSKLYIKSAGTDIINTKKYALFSSTSIDSPT